MSNAKRFIAGTLLLAGGAFAATLVTGVAHDSAIGQLELPADAGDALDRIDRVRSDVWAELDELGVPRVEVDELELPVVDFEQVGVAASLRSITREVYRHLPPPPPRPVTVYVDADGATLFPGPDQGRFSTSSLLLARGIKRMDIPGYAGSQRRLDSITRCMESRFEGFAVDVVTDRPSGGDYVTVHLGGDPSLIGREKSTRGLAPLTGRPIRNAPVFVFTHGTPSVTELCDAAAHEVGHALGLDHSRLCNDLMSYGSCGPKRFRDEPSTCGEYEDRACEDGQRTQNSAARLRDHVGHDHTTHRVS